MANLGDRIIVLIDMDCFFCQVESRLRPDLQGKPLAVVQYNQWRMGGIIAVNYEARDFGVTRHMRGDEAKEKCPEIALVSVPSIRGKADTSKYRFAGREVIDVLKKHCSIIERASVDEAYLDITELVDKRMESQVPIDNLPNSFVVGFCPDDSNTEELRKEGVHKWLEEIYGELGDEQSRKLAVAGVIVEELRSEIYSTTKFRCSAGISYNKILAKLACGLHKPNRQTILPSNAVPSLYSTLPVKKVRNLGGKFGNIVMETLGCNVMADLMRYSLHDLQKRFDEKTGFWLHNIARGIDNEPVVNRLVCKSIGASKNFPGKQAIAKLDVLKHWVGELASDVSDRLEQDLEENERRATTLTVSFSYYEDRKIISQSRSCPLKSYKCERIASQCVDILTKSTQKPIVNISIATGKFIPAKGSGNFVNFFKSAASDVKSKEMNERSTLNSNNSIKSSESSSAQDNNKNEQNAEKNYSIDINESLKQDNENNSKNFEVFKELIPAEDDGNFVNFFKSPECDEKSKKANEKSINEDTKLTKTNSPEKKENKNNEENVKVSDSKKTNCDTLKKPINSFFKKQVEGCENETVNSEPISPSTDILGSEQLRKALNRENLKKSFFMNFLKDAKPDVRNESLGIENECKSVQPIVQKPPSPPRKREIVQEAEKKDESNLLAQLKEIFPDLDNIDRSVVQLLPIELQRFANAYMKPKPIQSDQSTKTAVKNLKVKSVKSKNTPEKNSLQNFFIKTVGNSLADSDFRKCSECGQMIRNEKYPEHMDFHVARNLQREMNRIDSSTNMKLVSSDLECTGKRRRSDETTESTNKKTKSISSFFGR